MEKNVEASKVKVKARSRRRRLLKKRKLANSKSRIDEIKTQNISIKSSNEDTETETQNSNHSESESEPELPPFVDSHHDSQVLSRTHGTQRSDLDHKKMDPLLGNFLKWSHYKKKLKSVEAYVPKRL